MIIKSLIPARSGSKRIPDKNIRPLNGQPLMAYSIAISREVPEIANTYVSTNSKSYAGIAKDWGAKVISRPQKLSTDAIGDQLVIAHALKYMEPVDLIIYLRPTTPFRSASVVSKAIKTLINAKDKATGLRSVHEMSESAYKCCEIDYGFIQPLGLVSPAIHLDTPNQLLPKTYHPNGYVDIAKAELIRANELWGPDIIAFETPPVIELDTEEQWQYAEWLGDRIKVYG